MPEQSALNYFNTLRARQDLASGPGSMFDRARHLVEFDNRLNTPKPKPRQVTYGDVFRGLIGAGIGAGVARGAGRMLGMSERMVDKLETTGMGLGAAMNTGFIKRSEDEAYCKQEARNAAMVQQRKHAFRIGFLKAAKDIGLFKKEAIVPVIALNPADLFRIPGALAKGVARSANTLGTAAGVAVSPSEIDVDLTEDEIEGEFLREKLERLRRERDNAAIRKVLANRQA